MHEIYEDENYVYLLMDMHTGNNLSYYMKLNNNFIKEDISLVILEQILLTIDFINARGYNLH
jgi:hypothetical protein